MNVRAIPPLPELAIQDPEWWVSHKSRRAIRIVDMPNEHLAAAIQMVERGRDANGERIPDFCSSKLERLRAAAAHRALHVKEEGWDA